MKNQRISKLSQLIHKGVQIACPESVEIGDEVNIKNISGDGVVIHSGCKIFGRSTLILKGCKIGYEDTVTIENCQIGPEVELKGGFFKQAVFLAGAKAGLGSHVREATILEEQASIAHTVGLKHTILFPFVTLGSLINFCDCLMSGGTSRKNHSEVGSSYIHFNFTPNQDKATASLIGDVPQGVMLNQLPIFLGGQGGLVGPCRLAFGTTVAAGTIVRKDEQRSGRLLFGGAAKGGNVAFAPGQYRTEKRVVVNNTIYIANLMALRQWYTQVRSLFISKDFPEALLAGLKEKLDLAIKERIDRLGALFKQMRVDVGKSRKPAKELESSRDREQKQQLYQKWPELEEALMEQQIREGEQKLRDAFLKKVNQGIVKRGKDYISVIKGLAKADAETGTRWLQGIVDEITTEAFNIIPSFR